MGAPNGGGGSTSLGEDQINSLKLQSTCHQALGACEDASSCNRNLEQVKRLCDPKACDKKKCMRALQDMYHNIPHEFSLDIAFCLCK